MALAPTGNFNPQKWKADVFARLQQAIISRLILIGETFVSYARQNGGYGDITGNLRSSIGFAVLYNGQQVGFGGFETEHNGSDKATGQATGQRFLNSLFSQFPTGYALICVAGMEYAASVEARGKDVITGAGLMAEQDLREAIKKLNSKI